MAYSVDTGTQKYFESAIGIKDASPASYAFNSQAVSYNIDTGTQKYFLPSIGVVDSLPTNYIYAVSGAAAPPATAKNLALLGVG